MDKDGLVALQIAGQQHRWRVRLQANHCHERRATGSAESRDCLQSIRSRRPQSRDGAGARRRSVRRWLRGEPVCADAARGGPNVAEIAEQALGAPISTEDVNAVRLLLEAGAVPTRYRDGDGRPAAVIQRHLPRAPPTQAMRRYRSARRDLQRQRARLVKSGPASSYRPSANRRRRGTRSAPPQPRVCFHGWAARAAQCE